jgi:olefin beta-lactone synthetase
MNIASLLQERAHLQPQTTAIIDNTGRRERHHSYAHLSEDAGRYAALLRQHGIGSGDRILVFQPMSYELYVALMAIFKLGAVAMFVDPSAGRAHIDQCCELGTPRALIASARAQFLRLMSAQLRRIPTCFVTARYFPAAISMQRAKHLTPLAAITDCEAEAPALLTFTSGSTGRPKAASRSHAFLLAQHRALESALGLEACEIDLTTLPIFLLANLASGLTSVIPDADLRYPGRIEAAPVVDQITRLGASRSAGSPAFYQRLLEYCETHNTRFEELRRIDTGGAPVFPGLLQRLQEIAPKAEIFAVYGSTEAEPMAHVPWRQIGEDDLAAMRSGRGLLAGTPVADIDLRILRDRFGSKIEFCSPDEFASETLAPGETGEIVVHGAHVLDGYLHGEGNAETKFDVEGMRWHRTGDAGYLDDAGRLWLVGRCSARIDDEHGMLYPFCVECAAHFIAGLRRSAMVAHAGQRVLLVETESALAPESLQSSLAWAALDRIVTVARIPLDKRHNAKIDYTRLQALLEK